MYCFISSLRSEYEIFIPVSMFISKADFAAGSALQFPFISA